MGFGPRFGSIAARAPVWSLSAFGQKFEPERACYRRRFYQTNLDDITQPVHRTAARSDKGMSRLVIVEILGSQGTDRDQAVGPRIGQFHKQAGAGDAGD